MNNTISIGVMNVGTTEPEYYDYMITGKDGQILAYKKTGEDWVIVDAAAALDKCIEIIKQKPE